MGKYNFWQRNAQKARDSKNQQNVDAQQKASPASKENSQPFPKIKRNQLFGCSILTNGIYMSDSNKLDLLGIDHESESSFYRAQPKYSQPIINAANNSCNEILNRKKGLPNVSSDASCDHRRNGSWCFSYIMERKECFGFNTIGKTGGKRTFGTFTGTRNMMESTAFRCA